LEQKDNANFNRSPLGFQQTSVAIAADLTLIAISRTLSEWQIRSGIFFALRPGENPMGEA
jgi:hypothetical protein